MTGMQTHSGPAPRSTIQHEGPDVSSPLPESGYRSQGALPSQLPCTADAQPFQQSSADGHDLTGPSRPSQAISASVQEAVDPLEPGVTEHEFRIPQAANGHANASASPSDHDAQQSHARARDHALQIEGAQQHALSEAAVGSGMVIDSPAVTSGMTQAPLAAAFSHATSQEPSHVSAAGSDRGTSSRSLGKRPRYAVGSCHFTFVLDAHAIWHRPSARKRVL